VTTEELRKVDREWAELAGWKYEPKGWRDPDGDLTYYTKRFASRPDHCFGPGGPWGWMVANVMRPCVFDSYSGEDDKDDIAELYDPARRFHAMAQGRRQREHIEAYGSTEYEAITRCAIDAFKALQGEGKA
jgi:hypothetical protein